MQHYHNDIVLLSSLYVSLWRNNSRPSFFFHTNLFTRVVVYVFSLLLSQRTPYIMWEIFVYWNIYFAFWSFFLHKFTIHSNQKKKKNILKHLKLWLFYYYFLKAIAYMGETLSKLIRIRLCIETSCAWAQWTVLKRQPILTQLVYFSGACLLYSSQDHDPFWVLLNWIFWLLDASAHLPIA